MLWDYSPANYDLTHDTEIPEPWNLENKFWKARYIEYTDDSFTTQVKQPEYLGIQGPIFRAEVGDTIKVVFCNQVQPPEDPGSYPGVDNCEKRGISIHPHGVKYNKNDEGAAYEPPGTGASVDFGSCFTYKWDVPSSSGPLDNGPSSIVWLYHSHVDEDRDPRAGLYGSIIVTKAGLGISEQDPTPNDVNAEFSIVFFVHNENFGTEDEEVNMIHAMNGLFFGNLRGLTVNENDIVRWHVIGLGSEVDLHTVGIHHFIFIFSSINHLNNLGSLAWT